MLLESLPDSSGCLGVCSLVTVRVTGGKSANESAMPRRGIAQNSTWITPFSLRYRGFFLGRPPLAFPTRSCG